MAAFPLHVTAATLLDNQYSNKKERTDGKKQGNRKEELKRRKTKKGKMRNGLGKGKGETVGGKPPTRERQKRGKQGNRDSTRETVPKGRKRGR